jgi:polysaccharide deacetylase 2 family uncharacterized protein YibQ
MFGLTTKQSNLAWAVALIVYVAVIAAVVAWLSANSKDTIQRREAQSPSATVNLPGKTPEVPPSWQAPAPPPPAMPPPVTPPAVAPEAKPEAPAPEQTKAPEPAKPEPAKPDAAKPEAAASPVAAPLPPAVTTNPDAAPPPQKWQKYARPFDQKDTRPRIGLIIADLGMASTATQAAIQDLPGEVTLAFSSAAPDIEGWLAKSRAAGHENILTIPMEPDNYPQNDPGPNTLLLSLPDKDNVSRIRWAMARGDGYVAVTPYMGEKFVTDEQKLVPVLDVVREQQIMVLDGTMNKDSLIAPLSRLGHIPFVRSDMVIDAAASSQAIDTQLDALEKLARAKGQAIGVALPYPVTFDKLKDWIAGLGKKGIVLAPLTAMASEEVAPIVTQPPVEAPNNTLPVIPKPQ